MEGWCLVVVCRPELAASTGSVRLEGHSVVDRSRPVDDVAKIHDVSVLQGNGVKVRQVVVIRICSDCLVDLKSTSKSVD